MKQFPLTIFLTLSLFLSMVASGQHTQKVYLSGTAFNNTVDWDFYCSNGMNSGEWSKIAVPSQWEQQGFGEYTYGRWYKQKGKSPSQETGHYKTTFSLPPNKENKAVWIVFEGVMTDAKVLINGKQAGAVHQGGFYRFRYDISDLIVEGEENLLEVFVSKHSSDRTVNAAERMADWWLFGGIYRPVYLEIYPESYIADFKVNPKADGSFSANIEIENPPRKGSLEVKLTDLSGQNAQTYSTAINSSSVQINHFFDSIIPWTPENPQLYKIELSILSKGTVIHRIEERIGFRTIEVRPQDGLYCNGVKVILKGINRHTFWPESGRSTSPELSILDASLIKEMNMNAVRCHYPPDEHFLDACDSLGLFFIDELAGWQNAYRTEIGSKLVKEMIDRDANHPSVIMWSNGNEGGWNEEIDHLFSDLDPQKRDVIHPWADFDDIDTHHYPQYQTGIHRFNDGYRIFMPTEFLHGLYDEGHGAGLEDFWNKWTSHPLFAGGFLWAFNDGAILRSDTKLHDSDGQHAPDGVVGPYREKEGSFFTIKDIWSPIQFDPLFITPSFKGEFKISNHYLFTNLNECSMSYKLHSIPGPWEQNATQDLIASGTIELPSILPGEKRKIQMDLPASFFEGDLLSISAFDPNNKEIFTWTWPINYSHQFLNKKQALNFEGTASSIDISADLVTLKSNNSSATFHASKGLVQSMKANGKLMPLSGGPIPVGMKAQADKYITRQEGDVSVYTVWYKGAIDSIRWEMHPSGKLKMSMIALNKFRDDGGFDGGSIADKIELWGLTFDFPEEEVAGLRWFGKGPYRVWRNRQRGAVYGLWEKEYNNTITGESFEKLIYPEFKGYHANTYWASLLLKEKPPLTIASENNGLFLRVLTPEEPKGSLKRSLPHFPSGDISFLYEINAIHAFKPVSQMGPSSEPNSIRIKKGDMGIPMVLWFDLNNE